MKLKIFLFIALASVMIASCSVKLEQLGNYTGKWIAYSANDKNEVRPRPLGFEIKQSGEGYDLAVWYDTMSGEKTLAAESLTAEGDKFVAGDGSLIASLKPDGDRFTCRVTADFYNQINIGPPDLELKCVKYDPALNEIFDVSFEESFKLLDKFNNIMSDISRQRGIYSYKRFEKTGVIESVDKDKASVTMEVDNNIRVILYKLIPGSKFDNLKAGGSLAYKGRLNELVLPFVEGDPILFYLQDVVY